MSPQHFFSVQNHEPSNDLYSLLYFSVCFDFLADPLSLQQMRGAIFDIVRCDFSSFILPARGQDSTGPTSVAPLYMPLCKRCRMSESLCSQCLNALFVRLVSKPDACAVQCALGPLLAISTSMPAFIAYITTKALGIESVNGKSMHGAMSWTTSDDVLGRSLLSVVSSGHDVSYPECSRVVPVPATKLTHARFCSCSCNQLQSHSS